jgi:hypothetical protein
LWQQHFDLAAHRCQILVVEKRARSESGAVEDYGFAQARKLRTAFEFLDYNSAARDVEIAQQRVQVDRRLDRGDRAA